MDYQTWYPDILLICDANRGISCRTLKSLNKYAGDSPFICKTNNGIDIEAGDRIQNHRLSLLKKSNADYVLIMDDDDELITNLPNISEFDNADVVFYPFLINWEKESSFFTSQVFEIYAFCGTIVKRKYALKALEYTVSRGYFREDIGFFYYLAKNCPNQIISRYPIINKVKQREPQRSLFIKQHNRHEMDQYWRLKIKKLRSV